MKTSAVVRIIDCEKIREQKEQDLLDKLNNHDVEDPCWKWGPVYIQQHEHEMLPWSVAWLNKAIEKSKLGGMTYEQAMQALWEDMAKCNAPSKPPIAPAGVQIVVRTKPTGLSGGSSSTRRRIGHEAHLTVPFHRAPGSGSGTGGSGTGGSGLGSNPGGGVACQPVPEVVFLRNILVSAPRDLHVSTGGDLYIVPPVDGSHVFIINPGFTITGNIVALPLWLEPPNGVDIAHGGLRLTFFDSWIKAQLIRIIINDVQQNLENDSPDGIREDGIFELKYYEYTRVPLEAGVHSVRAEVLLETSGSVRASYNGETVLTGSFRRVHLVPSGTHGDVQIDFGTITVFDLELVELQVVGYESGNGSQQNPYRFYCRVVDQCAPEDITLDNFRLYNGNPVEAIFRPSSYDDEITMQSYQAINAEESFRSQEENSFAWRLHHYGIKSKIEGVYYVLEHEIVFRPFGESNYQEKIFALDAGERFIYVNFYRELEDINKIVITLDPSCYSGGAGTEDDPFVLVDYDTNPIFQVESQCIKYSANVTALNSTNYRLVSGGSFDIHPGERSSIFYEKNMTDYNLVDNFQFYLNRTGEDYDKGRTCFYNMQSGQHHKVCIYVYHPPKGN